MTVPRLGAGFSALSCAEGTISLMLPGPNISLRMILQAGSINVSALVFGWLMCSEISFVVTQRQDHSSWWFSSYILPRCQFISQWNKIVHVLIVTSMVKCAHHHKKMLFFGKESSLSEDISQIVSDFL